MYKNVYEARRKIGDSYEDYRKDRIKGGILGLIIGDALGVPYEFHPPEKIPRWADTE